MSEYKAAFFIVPARIMKLPNLTFAFLRIYETIFQFWNHDRPCVLKNETIMERAEICSLTTLREAFVYFESHGEMRRETKKGQRYFIQPTRYISIEDDQEEPKESKKESKRGTSAVVGGGTSAVVGQGTSTVVPINKEFKKKNLNKDVATSNDKKTYNNQSPVFASVEHQSNSYNPDAMITTHPVSSYLDEFMNKQGNQT